MEEEEGPADGPVAPGDEADEAEGGDAETDEGHRSADKAAAGVGELLALAVHHPRIEPLVDGVDEPGGRLDHRPEKDHQEDRQEPGGYLGQDGVSWQFHLEDAGVEAHQDQVEEEAREDRQDRRHCPRYEGFLPGLDGAECEKDGRKRGQVVEGVLEPPQGPAFPDITGSHVRAYLAPHLGEPHEEEDQEDRVEDEGPPRQGDLDDVAAEEGQRGDARQEEAGPHQGRQPEGLLEDAPRSGSDDAEDDEEEDYVADLVEHPAGSYEFLEKAPVVVNLEGPGELKTHGVDDGPQDRGYQHHAKNAAEAAEIPEVLDEFTTCAVTPGDDDGLGNKAGKDELLVEGRTHHFAEKTPVHNGVAHFVRHLLCLVVCPPRYRASLKCPPVFFSQDVP